MFWLFLACCFIFGLFFARKNTMSDVMIENDSEISEMNSAEIDPDITVSGLYPSSDDE
jgi:phage-related protein